MILAGLIPFLHGRAHVAILDTAATRVLAVRSYEVGRLESLATPALDERGRPRDMKRIVDAAGLDSLLSAFFRLLEQHGTEHAIVETPRGEGGVAAEHARSVVSALVYAAERVGLGDFVSVVDPSWREAMGGREGIAERAGRVSGWPTSAEAGDGEGARLAAGLVLAHAAPRRNDGDENQGSVGVQHGERTGQHLGLVEDGQQDHDRGIDAWNRVRADGDTGLDGAGGDLGGRVAGVGAAGGVLSDSARRSAAVALHVPPADAPPGRRAIHVDPGARWIGLVVTCEAEAGAVDSELVKGSPQASEVRFSGATGAGPSSLVACHVETRELGRVAPLPRPQKKTRRDGSEVIVTERRVVEWPDVVALADAVVALALSYGCTCATVEHVREPYTSGDAAAAAGQARGIVRTSEAGGVIAYGLEKAGIAVRRPGVATVRAVVVGKSNAKGDARRGLVGAAVAARIRDWPADTDAHMRDAGALALWSVMPPPAPPEPRPERVRRPTRSGRDESRRKRYDEPAALRAREERAAAKRAAGCECRGNHRRTCPLYTQRLRGL